MKKYIPAIIAATIIFAGCANNPPRQTAHHSNSHHRHIHHFSDGRVGYVDNSGIWWYLVATHMSNGSTSTAGSYSSAATWTQGSAPSKTDVQNSQQEEVEVGNAADQTLDQPESAEDAGAASVPDAGEPLETTDENVEPAAEEAPVEAPAESNSDSGVSDSGSSDSGSSGGGDSGGGGE